MPSEEYRNYLRNILLEKADDMKDRCMYCAKEEEDTPEKTEWIQCDNCNR